MWHTNQRCSDNDYNVSNSTDKRQNQVGVYGARGSTLSIHQGAVFEQIADQTLCSAHRVRGPILVLWLEFRTFGALQLPVL